MNTGAVIIAIAAILLGIVGTFVPFIPGIPLIFIAILAYGWYEGFHTISITYILIMGGLAVISVAVEYLSSILGAKYFGSSKKGVWGAIIGLVLGVFFIPPLGILIGPWVGACAGELMAGKDMATAMRTGLGTIVGIFSGITINLIIAVIMFISFLIIIF